MITTNVMIPAYVDKKQIKREGPSVLVMTITPDIAAFWLKTYNASNRPIRDAHVNYLVQQMKSGQWVSMNGDTISFAVDGQLNDGQHRLTAVAESGLSYSFVVMVGVPKEAFKVMDTGKVRSGADVLSIEGYRYYQLMSSTCSFLISWEANRKSNATSGSRTSNSITITNTDISNFASKHRESLTGKCSTLTKYYSTGDKLVTPTWCASFLFLFSKSNSKEAERFIFQLATGSNVEHGSLMYQLRQKLRQSKESEAHKLSARMRLALLIKCWNARILNSSIKKLTFSPKRGDKFPTII